MTDAREYIVKLVDEESRDFLEGKTRPLDYFARVEAIFTVVREQMREERIALAMKGVIEKFLPPEVK